MKDLEKIAVATLTGMSTEQFQAEVKQWLAEAKDPRWHKPYTELTYQPMQEVLKYLRANGYKTYICHRRRAGFRARLFRTNLWHPARTGRRQRGRHEIWL